MDENSKIRLTMNDIEKLFDHIRYIDTENETIHTENPQDENSSYIPAFDYTEENKLRYSSPLVEKAVYRLKQEGESLLMYAIIPSYHMEKEVLIECSVNITKRLDVFQYQTALDTIYKLSITDELTNMYNRRYMNQTLPIAIADCINKKKSLSAIFIDLDSFKKINDFYGHAAGDSILHEFATELQTHIRQNSDWVARYGGDEFFLCFPGLDYDCAKERAENIRISIEKRNFYYLDSVIKITCSFGIYSLEDFNTPTTTENFLNEIDKRLYLAKRSGKNKIC